jgi:hypothetical protein
MGPLQIAFFDFELLRKKFRYFSNSPPRKDPLSHGLGANCLDYLDCLEMARFLPLKGLGCPGKYLEEVLGSNPGHPAFGDRERDVWDSTLKKDTVKTG